MSLILDALRQSKQRLGPVTADEVPTMVSGTQTANGLSSSQLCWFARYLAPALSPCGSGAQRRSMAQTMPCQIYRRYRLCSSHPVGSCLNR